MKAVKYLNEMISTAENFQYAINIAYDFSDDKKIENYIATNDAIRIIEDVLLSTKDNSTDRARLFVGAYGKGKSHLALILIALVYKKDRHVFENLMKKVKLVNNDLYDYLNEYIQSEKRLLPVVVEGNKFSLQQSMLSALKSALEHEKIDDIMPNTFFSVAIETIEMWEKDYKDTYLQFTKLINVSVEKFKMKLRNFEQQALIGFETIYPKLTSGSKFTPILNGDVISLYEDVIKEIKAYGFSGIFLVYDEFSKYLEGNMQSTTATDIKMLQDLAEKANRSGNEQFHLLMISHKNIINYVDDLPKVKVDAWKAVSERFKTVELSNSSIQLYDLISHVIIKDEKKFNDFYRTNKNEFDNIANQYINKNLFAGISKNQLEKIIKETYPLEPTSLYMLPAISEKVAQNERSMFTFLSSKNDKNALYNILRSQSAYVSPDIIFDYFEEQFKNEAYTTSVYKYWKLVLTSINLLKELNEIQVKLIKTLAMIYILDQLEIIKPSSDNLLLILGNSGYSHTDIIGGIESLKERGVFKYSSRTHYLRLSERTDINIDEVLKDTIERRKGIFNPLAILNKESEKVFLYPNGYNDEHEIIRYFTFEFISTADCCDIEDWDKRISDQYASGTLFALYDAHKNKNLSIVNKVDNERVVFALSRFTQNIDEILKQFDALSFLIENADDELFRDELMFVFDEVEEQVVSYIQGFINPSKKCVTYIHNGQEVVLYRKSQLSNLLTSICDSLYKYTPTIVNEVVNKSNISKQAINSRNKVLEGLLENEIRKNLGLTGTGQDVSFFRSVIQNKGVYIEDEDKYSIVTEGLTDDELNHTFRVIKGFILSTSTEGAKNLGDLYYELTHTKYGIGLKTGIIPFFLAAVLHHYKRFAVIKKKDKEFTINANLLDSINNNPSQYEIILESWSTEKEAYIGQLEDAFGAYLVVGEKEYNTFEYIVKAMQRWFYRLPKYSKDAELVIEPGFNVKSKAVKRFRQMLKSPEINARELLFEKLPKAFSAKEINDALGKNIGKSKKIIDMQISYLQRDIENELINVLSTEKVEKRPLYTIAVDWHESLNSRTKEHLFTNGEGKLLSVIGNVQNDLDEFIKRIGRELSGIHIVDWNDDTFETVRTRLHSQIKNINEFNLAKDEINSSSYKVSLLDENGTEEEKTFDKLEVSRRGKMLYNELVSSIGEYGNALSDGEKRQILMNVMMDYLK